MHESMEMRRKKPAREGESVGGKRAAPQVMRAKADIKVGEGPDLGERRT
jgi:hypothetical protein